MRINQQNYIIFLLLILGLSYTFKHFSLDFLSGLLGFVLIILMYLRLKDAGQPLYKMLYMFFTGGLYGCFISSKPTENNANGNHIIKKPIIKNNQKIIIDAFPMHDDYNDSPFTTYPKFVRYKAFNKDNASFWGETSNFTVIDFETANCYPDSVCQMGITVIRNNQIHKTLSYKVNPPYKYFKNSHIHGITKEDVKDALSFSQLWPSIKEYIDGQLIAAYNLSFDAGCLEALFKCYNIKNVSYAALDILQTAKDTWPNMVNHKLVTVASNLNIPLDAHDAGSDSTAAAKIQILANQINPSVYITFSNNSTKEQIIDFKFKFNRSYYKLDELNKILQINQSTNIEDHEKFIKTFNIYIENTPDNKTLALLWRLYGELLEKCNRQEDAYNAFNKALTYNDKVGVKRKVNQLKKLLNN